MYRYDADADASFGSRQRPFWTSKVHHRKRDLREGSIKSSLPFVFHTGLIGRYIGVISLDMYLVLSSGYLEASKCGAIFHENSCVDIWLLKPRFLFVSLVLGCFWSEHLWRATIRFLLPCNKPGITTSRCHANWDVSVSELIFNSIYVLDPFQMVSVCLGHIKTRGWKSWKFDVSEAYNSAQHGTRKYIKTIQNIRRHASI